MDALFWSQNWTPVAESEFITKLGRVVSGEKWILGDNYHRTKDLKWSRVETIIWLDFSFLCIFKRALGRALLRIWRTQEIWAGTGNRETWARTFLSKDSVLLWTLTSYNGVKRRYAGIYENQEDSPYKVDWILQIRPGPFYPRLYKRGSMLLSQAMRNDEASRGGQIRSQGMLISSLSTGNQKPGES